MHIVTGVSGRSHDRNAIEWSLRLRKWLNDLPQEYYIPADSAYIGYHHKCLTLHRNPQNPDEMEFNNHAKSIRVLVENTIGANETIWRAIMAKENRLPAKSGPEFAGNLIILAGVLHNRFTNYIQ